MTARLIIGDVFDGLRSLEDGSVDLVFTSRRSWYSDVCLKHSRYLAVGSKRCPSRLAVAGNGQRSATETDTASSSTPAPTARYTLGRIGGPTNTSSDRSAPATWSCIHATTRHAATQIISTRARRSTTTTTRSPRAAPFACGAGRSTSLGKRIASAVTRSVAATCGSTPRLGTGAAANAHLILRGRDITAARERGWF